MVRTTAAEPELRMDDDSYLAFERGSQTKHVLWDGEVFAMTGASLAHNRIVRNLVYKLADALDGSPCEALPSDMRVRVPPKGRYVYPDVTIVCGPPELDGDSDILLNPSVIIEVLSDSTAAFDLGDKFVGYRMISGLEQVVFVSQHQRRVECYTRQGDDSWLLRTSRDAAAVALHSLAEPLALERIYAGVEFGE